MNLGSYPLNNALISDALDVQFPIGWGVNEYNSPSEKLNEKPAGLLKGDSTTFGDLRSYPGPDTLILEAFFYSADQRIHTNVFTSIQKATNWLAKQNPAHQDVHLQENQYE